jgi:precorrin-8X/cobalt-precorrin-8 methylmutase
LLNFVKDKKMSVTIRNIRPEEIEAESFRMITEELGPTDFDSREYKVVQRVIHATGDFNFAENIRIAPGAIDTAIAAIQAGKDILTDVTMVAAGVSKAMLAKCGGEVHCWLSDPGVVEEAKQTGKTRSEVAIERGLKAGVGIVAIGNAPTALVKVMECLDTINPSDRPLVVGVPVGFVNAAESKEMLSEKNYPFITSLGRKGGSPVAAAMVNALIRLAIK